MTRGISIINFLGIFLRSDERVFNMTTIKSDTLRTSEEITRL